jgi:hypothetical protein
MIPRRARRVGAILNLVPAMFFLSGPTVTAAESKVPEKIQAVLDAQVVAWNRGDVAGFMEGYQRSPDLIYIGNKSVTRGWQALLDSYRSRFKQPGGIDMGVLRLSEENVTMLGADAAIIWGTFDVSTADGKRRGGLYTLVMRNLSEGWRTVYDRTSTEAL